MYFGEVGHKLYKTSCGIFLWEIVVSVCRVDERHRIVVDKRIRRQMNIKAGDIVILEPIDDHSFKVMVMDFSMERLEDDPAWKAIHTPIKAESYIPPEKLEKIMEEEVWRE